MEGMRMEGWKGVGTAEARVRLIEHEKEICRAGAE